MPFELKWEDEGVLAEFRGVLTDDDLMLCGDDIYGSERVWESRYAIYNYTGVGDVSFGQEAIRQLIERAFQRAPVFPGAKIAIVTTSPLAWGLTREYMSAIERSEWSAGVFETMEEAREWVASAAERTERRAEDAEKARAGD